MKVIKNQKAPDFTIKDIYGKEIRLSDFKGKKVFLSFFRTAGCPVCNVRFHELQKEENFFRNHNLVFIAVYNSERNNLYNYVASVYGSTLPYPIFIADKQLSLYRQFEVQQSMGKLLKGLLFHGGFADFNRGNTLFKQTNVKPKDDGSTTLVSTEFLIDEKGNVVTANYGNFAGDFIAIKDIKQFAEQ